MDPKMDSGYLAPGEKLDDDYDVLRPLLPGEVIGIMDQLICFEVGLCSPQTRFASDLSDADLGLVRWPGIWVTHFPSRCLAHFILINYSGRIRNLWKKRALIEKVKPGMKTRWCTLYCEPTV